MTLALGADETVGKLDGAADGSEDGIRVANETISMASIYAWILTVSFVSSSSHMYTSLQHTQGMTTHLWIFFDVTETNVKGAVGN